MARWSRGRPSRPPSTDGPVDADPARRYWGLWSRGEQPDAADFLARAGVSDPEEIVRVLRVDQAERCERGQWVAAEAYLDAFPAVRASGVSAVDLVFAEYLLREERGERPPLAEFLGRFPQYADELRLQIEVHAAIGSTHLPAGPPPPAGAETLLIEGGEAADGGPASFPEIPGYEVLGELGRGGMGVVYRAWQAELKRQVAIKMVHAGALAGTEVVARFRVEAEAVARLRHPNFVQIHHVGHHAGAAFLVLELVEGGSLAHRLAGAPQPAEWAATTIETLARAIAAAHRQGVVHRDLSPSNILLGADGVPKITDFGLAKLIVGEGSLRTQTGDLLGTPSYMAPEQAAGMSREAGAATDVYGLGAILYELLTGRPPFKAGTPLETLQQVVHDEPVPPSRLRPRLPRDLETICLKCLEKEPRKRFAIAEDLADELGRFLDGRPIRSRPIGRGARLLRWCLRNRAVAAAVGLAAAAVAAGFAASLIFAIDASRSADRLRVALDESRRVAAGLAQDRGQALCEQGDIGRGVLWLGRGLELAGLVDAPDLRRGIRASLGAWCREIHPLRAILAQPAEVSAIAISPDGALAATGGADGAVRLWDAASGRLVGPMPPHPGPVRFVIFRRDGGAILSAGGDGPALLRSRDPSARAASPTSLGHPGGVLVGAFRPDGGTILTGGRDGTARVWDAATGREAGPSLAHAAPVFAVAFSPDGRLVLTGGGDRQVRLWDPATGASLWAAGGHRGAVRTVAFSPDGRTIASGGEEGMAMLHDARTGRARCGGLRHSATVHAVAFSPDGALLLTASRDWKARLWRVATGQEVGHTQGHLAPVESAAFSPDGRLVLTGSRDGTARLWEAESFRPVGPPLVHAGPVTAVAFGADGRTALTADGSPAARLWEVRGDRPATRSLPDEGWLASVAFRGDGRRIALAAEGRPVRVFEAGTGRPVGPPLPHPGGVRALAFLRDGRTLITAGEDEAFRFWDVATGRETRPALRDSGKLHVLAIRPDDRALLVGRHREGTISLWDLDRGRRREASPFSRGPVLCLAWSPDGRSFLSGHADRAAQLWRADTLEPRGRPLPHRGQVWAVAFSDDGHLAATGGDDGAVHFLDADTGRPTGPPLANRWPIRSMALAPDARSILVGSWFEPSRLWDVATARPIGPPIPHAGAILAAAVDRDAARFLMVTEDKSVRSHPLPAAPEYNDARIGLWIRVTTCMELDDQGGAAPLDPGTWERDRRRLHAAP